MIRLFIIFIAALVVMAAPPPAFAQGQTGSGPASTGPSQPGISQGTRHSVGTIAGMMKEIHLLLHQAPLTPEQARQVTEMMTTIGIMLQEMRGPLTETKEAQHRQQLRELEEQLRSLKRQLGVK